MTIYYGSCPVLFDFLDGHTSKHEIEGSLSILWPTRRLPTKDLSMLSHITTVWPQSMFSCCHRIMASRARRWLCHHGIQDQIVRFSHCHPMLACTVRLEKAIIPRNWFMWLLEKDHDIQVSHLQLCPKSCHANTSTYHMKIPRTKYGRIYCLDVHLSIQQLIIPDAFWSSLRFLHLYPRLEYLIEGGLVLLKKFDPFLWRIFRDSSFESLNIR